MGNNKPGYSHRGSEQLGMNRNAALRKCRFRVGLIPLGARCQRLVVEEVLYLPRSPILKSSGPCCDHGWNCMKSQIVPKVLVDNYPLTPLLWKYCVLGQRGSSDAPMAVFPRGEAFLEILSSPVTTRRQKDKCTKPTRQASNGRKWSLLARERQLAIENWHPRHGVKWPVKTFHINKWQGLRGCGLAYGHCNEVDHQEMTMYERSGLVSCTVMWRLWCYEAPQHKKRFEWGLGLGIETVGRK